LEELRYCSEDPLNFSESEGGSRILPAMKVLMSIVVGLLVVERGKKDYAIKPCP
jgi:hypothetical protein